MTNPYAGTPLWARYYSEQMGWPVTDGVLNAADGPCRCDSCGATEYGPGDPLTLNQSYCFGCGAVSCEACATTPIGAHRQSDHGPHAANAAPDRPAGVESPRP